jgi:hypothetical protein
MIFVFFFACIGNGILGGIVYLVYNIFRYRFLQSGKLSKKRDRQINKLYVSLLILISAVQTYLAFYPTDKFFFNEFESVTLRKIPSSAVVIKKEASYPDIHGEYCSSSLLNLSNKDYDNLYNELTMDNRFKKNGEILSAEEFDRILNKEKSKDIEYFVQVRDYKKIWDYCYIGFLGDKHTIVINKCNN